MLQKLWRIGQPGINQVTINGYIYYLYQLYRLEKKKVLHHKQMAAETPEKRAVRLEHKRDLQQQRLATESPEERDLRLQHMRDLQQQRLATESPEERSKRLQQKREARQSAGQEHKNYLPLQEVQREMAKFHQAMSTIQSPACSTCLEQFPGIKLSSKSAECVRCARDKLTPKLYSAANNMSPGKNVPEELQVSYL